MVKMIQNKISDDVYLSSLHSMVNEKFTMHRNSVKKSQFYRITFFKTPIKIINWEKKQSNSKFRYGYEVIFNSPNIDISINCPRGEYFNCITLTFHKSWVEKFNGLRKLSLSNHISLDKTFYMRRIMSNSVLSIMNGALNPNVDERLRLDFQKIKLQELMLVLFEDFEFRLNSQIYTNSLKPNDVRLMIKSRKIILEDCYRKVPLKVLASDIGMSMSKYSKLYLDLFGISPGRDYQNQRILLIHKLIYNGFDINQITQKMGYSSTTNLMKVLRKGYYTFNQ